MLHKLDILANKLFDASLSPTERNELNELLSNHECRRRFVELNKVHYCLSQRVLSVSTLQTAAAASAVHNNILSLSPFDSNEQEAHVSSRRRKYARRITRNDFEWRTIAVVVAVCCIGAVGLLKSSNSGAFIADRASGPTPPSVRPEITSALSAKRISAEGFAARIVSISADCEWSPDGGPSDFLMRLPVGEELKLTNGMVKLEFALGASAILGAPAQLRIIGPGEVRLQHGRFTGTSDQGDFIVRTPSAVVVDVGTAFGVAVDDAATDVVVFDGEVHVRRPSDDLQLVRLTSGMSARADDKGLSSTEGDVDRQSFNQEFNGQRPKSLGTNELSLVDIICGSDPGEYRSAGSIDPETGAWSTLPWSESKGVGGKLSNGKVVPVDWNPWVHAVFIPNPKSDRIAVDLEGGHVGTPELQGGAWGPIWARRRIERHLDPLVSKTDQDVEGFWGAGTTTALLERARWVRDGIVGMHANVGITVNLAAIRRTYGVELKAFRGVLAHLERSYVSQPFQPQAEATFQIYVDGQLRYERANFCRDDGDAMFGADLHDNDRFLSLVVTDGHDGPIYDRVILLDPILESRND